MEPTWVLSAPDGPHVGPMNLAIRDYLPWCKSFAMFYAQIDIATFISNCDKDIPHSFVRPDSGYLMWSMTSALTHFPVDQNGGNHEDVEFNVIEWEHFSMDNIWGLCCQKQVSQAGISNYIPQLTVGCNYLSPPEIPASDNNVLISIDTLSPGQNGRHFANIISECIL